MAFFEWSYGELLGFRELESALTTIHAPQAGARHHAAVIEGSRWPPSAAPVGPIYAYERTAVRGYGAAKEGPWNAYRLSCPAAASWWAPSP